MKLNTLVKTNSPKMRVGRGIGSGKGKTSGRGVKGQKSRSGVAIKSFEGGQMPLYRRLPKRGFKSFNAQKPALINLSKIQELIDKKKITPENKLNLVFFKKINLINKKYKKIKLLGAGDINSKLDIEVNFASNSAKTKIEKKGGKVVLVEKRVS